MSSSDSTTSIRRCKECGNEYPATTDFFAPTCANRDWLSTKCRICLRVKKRVLNDKDTARQKRRLYETSNPKAKKRIAEYRHKNIERARAWSRASYARNRDKQALRQHRRSQRTKRLDFNCTNEDWHRCLEYFGYCCAICGRPQGLWHVLVMDHWIPVNSPECPGTVKTNIIPLCHSQKDGEGGCNNSKSDSDPIEWLTEKLGPRKAKKKLAEIRAYFDSIKEIQ